MPAEHKSTVCSLSLQLSQQHLMYEYNNVFCGQLYPALQHHVPDAPLSSCLYCICLMQVFRFACTADCTADCMQTYAL